MMELLLVAAGIIIVIVFFLYLREKKIVGRYSHLLEEREKIERLSKQVQLDYYKRRMAEDTLRQVLADYSEKARVLDDEINEIAKKHGIQVKRGYEKHQEKEAASEAGSGKLEGEGA